MPKHMRAKDAALSSQSNEQDVHNAGIKQNPGSGPGPNSSDLAAPQPAIQPDGGTRQTTPGENGEASDFASNTPPAIKENTSAPSTRQRTIGRPATPDAALGEQALKSREKEINPSLVSGLQEKELEHLRELLLGKEISELEDLRNRFIDTEARAREVSEVVTEALFLRSSRDNKLNTVLTPTVEHIFKNSLRHNPEEIADELFPVMGPAIRRSIAESFRSMLQSFHKTLEMSFSTKGLRWRLQALRTGKPFSEIVLLNTLVYRVEEIFLIHTKTGLVLEHLVNEVVQAQDADLVSGMLTALQDFVADCFARGDDGGELEGMQMGERRVFVVRSRQAYLAFVVQGEPPINLLEEFRSTLDLILVDCAKELANFKGDPSPFKKARRHLEPYLITRYAHEGKEVPLPVKIMPFAAIALLAIFFIFIKVKQSYWHDAIEMLDMQPGFAVSRVEPSLFGNWKIFLIQDPITEDPKKLLVEYGFPEDRLEVESKPYLSLDEQLVRERVLQAILPPPGVSMSFDNDGVLSLKGHANMGWILATREKAMSIAGVEDVNTKELTDPRTDKLRALVSQVEGLNIHFPVDKSLPIPEDKDKLARAVDCMVEIEKLAADMGLSVNLIVYGHADATGSDKHNYELSQERAKTLAAMLYARGSSIPISTYGMGADHATRVEGRGMSDPKSRKIELRVRLAQSGITLPDFLGN